MSSDQNQGVAGTAFPAMAPGGYRPCSLPAPDGCGIPWLMACHGRLCLIFTAFPSVYLCELFLCLYFF